MSGGYLYWCEHGQISTECTDCNSGSLEQENPGENDYTLREGYISCWITVDNLSVYIVRTDEGVVVDIFPRWREEDESLASCYAFNAEVATEEERAMGMSDAPAG